MQKYESIEVHRMNEEKTTCKGIEIDKIDIFHIYLLPRLLWKHRKRAERGSGSRPTGARKQ